MKKILRLALLWSLAAADARATNGYFLNGYGTPQKGEGGAGIAFPQDALTVATNPAGLGNVADAFSIGLEFFQPNRGATLDQQGQPIGYSANGTKTFYLPEIGYSRHLSDRFSWGIGLYGNGGLDTNYPSNPYARFAPPGSNLGAGSAGVNLQQAFLSPAVAYKINEANTIGLSVNVAYQRFEANGVGLFSGFSSDPTAVSNNGYDGSFGAGVRLGWLGHIGDRLTLGATWQSKTDMQRFTKYAGLFADQGSFDVPQTYGLGLAFKPDKQWTVALDWQRILYSGVPAVGNPINALFQNVPLGATDGPGFGWRNVSVYKLGINYALNTTVTLRAGYSYSQQPIPASQTFFNILAPGTIQQHLTIGGTWNLSGRNAISAAYVHAFKNTVYGQGSIPPDFGGGEANIDLEENSLAVSFSHGFR